MQTRYTDILANAFSEVRAWKLTTIAVSCLCAVLAMALIWQTQSTPIVLVPAGLAENQGRIVVEPNAGSGTSPDYLSQIALGDLALVLTWQPDNVLLQFQRFLNRATSELYARENVRLLAEAETHRKEGSSQSFYPETVQVNVKAAQVVIDGYLVRWTGEKESVRTKSRFTVTYQIQKGFLHVADLELTR
jgi:type IV conjugative transfer system protein TraE